MRCVIVCAAPINDYGKIKAYLRQDDFFIFCDAGLSHANRLGVSPNLIIGDFDSFKGTQSDIEVFKAETVRLPREKDDTDSFYAAKQAIARGFREVLLIGAAGKRLDHTFANLSILEYLEKNGVHAVLADDYSEMEIVTPEKTEAAPVLIGPEYSFFSTVSLAEESQGITIRNAKYPLEDGTITTKYQYGISNEVEPGKTAELTVRKGLILLIKITGE